MPSASVSTDSFGSSGKASTLSPTPSPSVSADSLASIGKASVLSPMPSASVSTDSFGSSGKASFSSAIPSPSVSNRSATDPVTLTLRAFASDGNVILAEKLVPGESFDVSTVTDPHFFWPPTRTPPPTESAIAELLDLLGEIVIRPPPSLMTHSRSLDTLFAANSPKLTLLGDALKLRSSGRWYAGTDIG